MTQERHEYEVDRQQLDINLQLNRIQSDLKAPKGQMNKFGNYKYRSCEDILEAIKPILGDCSLILNDEIVLIGERYYVKATATLFNSEGRTSASAFAREPLSKKGMDESQITGAASSYARKYALNGLFSIDDTKDADTMDNTKTSYNKKRVRQPNSPADLSKEARQSFEAMKEALEMEDYQVVFENYKDIVNVEEQTQVWFCFNSKERSLLKKRFAEITNGERL